MGESGSNRTPIDLAAWRARKMGDVTQHPSGLIIARPNLETVLQSVLGYKLPQGDPAKVFFTQLQTGFAQVRPLHVPIHLGEVGRDQFVDMEFARHAARPELAAKIPDQHPLGGFFLMQYLDADTKRPMIEIVGVDDMRGLQTERRNSNQECRALFAITLAATGYQKYELVRDPQNIFATDNTTLKPVQEFLSQFILDVVGPKLPLGSADRRLWEIASNGMNFFAYQFSPELPRGSSPPPKIA